MISNLKLEFGEVALDFIGGSPHRTRVVLKNDDGAYYPVFFEPDAIKKTDAELYQMAMNVVYEKNAYQRAENEKFNAIGQKIAEVDDAIERSDQVINEVKRLSATSRNAFLKVMMKLYEKDVLTDDEMEELGLFDED